MVSPTLTAKLKWFTNNEFHCDVDHISETLGCIDCAAITNVAADLNPAATEHAGVMEKAVLLNLVVKRELRVCNDAKCKHAT